MSGWSVCEGPAVALPLENVDTDQLIPARFMSTPRAEGYGRFLLHDLRRENGALRPDFPLNRADAEGARILVAGRNFGAGSSREAAVYALADAGFRAVLAPSFGDIFAANAVNNGLLPARIADPSPLFAALPATLAVDLETCRVRGAGLDLPFEIDPVWRLKLMRGWDDIDLTASHAGAIAAFAAARRAAAPWVWPADAENRGARSATTGRTT